MAVEGVTLWRLVFWPVVAQVPVGTRRIFWSPPYARPISAVREADWPNWSTLSSLPLAPPLPLHVGNTVALPHPAVGAVILAKSRPIGAG